MHHPTRSKPVPQLQTMAESVRSSWVMSLKCLGQLELRKDTHGTESSAVGFGFGSRAWAGGSLSDPFDGRAVKVCQRRFLRGVKGRGIPRGATAGLGAPPTQTQVSFQQESAETRTSDFAGQIHS